MKMKFFIDTHKGITVLVMLAFMVTFGRWQNATAWVYLSLHGTYGLLWAAKSRLFPDCDWEERVSWLFRVVAIWGGLTTCWVAGWIVFARSVVAPGRLLGLDTLLFSVGAFFHFGKLLIYLGFSLLAMHRHHAFAEYKRRTRTATRH